MRFVCSDCGQEYEDGAPAAVLESTSNAPWSARHSRGPSRIIHDCVPGDVRDDAEPGSLFDAR